MKDYLSKLETRGKWLPSALTGLLSVGLMALALFFEGRFNLRAVDRLILPPFLALTWAT